MLRLFARRFTAAARHFAAEEALIKHPPDKASTVTQHTAKIWIDNLSTSNFFLRYRPDLLQYLQILNPLHPETRQTLIENALRDFIPPNLTQHQFKVTDVIPRVKDRGIFVEFSYQAEPGQARFALDDILHIIRNHLGHEIEQGYSTSSTVSGTWLPKLFRIRAYLVKGEPFMEDILSKTASSKLKVEFYGPDPPVEKLYKELRPFGRIVDLTYPPPSVKDLPRSAVIQFRNIASAASAKNCLHNYKIGDTRLALNYEKFIPTNVIRKWIVDHPRIVVPVATGLTIASGAAMFDPIRMVSIKATITHRLRLPLDMDLPENSWFARLKKILREFWASIQMRYQGFSRWAQLSKKEENEAIVKDSMAGVWEGTENAQRKIENWLNERPASFMLVVGPKGSGKSELIDRVLDGKPMSITIKCHELTSGKNESEIVSRLASAIGYFPVFAMFDSLAHVADSMVTAATGQKTGLSASFEARVKQILDMAALVLAQIVDEQEAAVESGKASRVRYPIVVIDAFMGNDRSMNLPAHQKLYDELAAWGAFLTQNGLAHVIFVSTGVGTYGHGASKLLTKVLPKRAFETVIFSDPQPDNAYRYVVERLGDKISPEMQPSLRMAIRRMGCRIADLELFIEKVQGGMSIDDAVNELILRAIVEIRKYGLGEEFTPTTEDGKKRQWIPVQFWYLLKELVANDGQVSFDVIKNATLFKGDDMALYAMEKAELIAILFDRGHPISIVPGKPIYRAAFADIKTSPASGAHDFDAQMYKAMIDQETTKIKTMEAELGQLATVLQSSEGLKEGALLSDAKQEEEGGRGGWSWFRQRGHQVSSSDMRQCVLSRFAFVSEQMHASQVKVNEWHVKYKQALKDVQKATKKKDE